MLLKYLNNSVKDDCALILWKQLKRKLRNVSSNNKSKGGRPEKLSLPDLIFSLIYHTINPIGKLSIKVKRCSGMEISDSALSQKRQNIPWELFNEVMAQQLGSIAKECKHSQSFYKGYHLLGIDGTTFSIRNTSATSSLPKRNSQNKKSKKKHKYSEDGYAYLWANSLVELGVHNPIAAEIGIKNESEWALGIKLIKSLPPKSLLLADRLYGKPSFVSRLEKHFKKSGGGAYLVRVGKQPKTKVKKILSDGSALVEIVVRNKRSQSKITERILLREIQVKVISPLNNKVSIVRLWTNLLDHEIYPLAELVDLYSKRWEHEIYYGTIKKKLTGGNLLRAQSIQTALQEIAAHVIASALIAQYRCKAIDEGKDDEVNDPTRISVQKVNDELSVFWRLVEYKSKLNLKSSQIKSGAKLMSENLLEQMTPKRKRRSCPRGTRRTPRKCWPRILARIESNEPCKIEVVQYCV